MFTDDFNNSIEDFKNIQPELERILKGEIVPIEGNGEIAKILDIHCGIDYILKHKLGVRGIASRIQRGKNWHTFTIRAKKATGNTTEYEKRITALKYNFIYPYYTMQAYKTDKGFEGAICHTDELYQIIQNGGCRTNKTDNAMFYIVDWDMLKDIKFFKVDTI